MALRSGGRGVGRGWFDGFGVDVHILLYVEMCIKINTSYPTPLEILRSRGTPTWYGDFYKVCSSSAWRVYSSPLIYPHYTSIYTYHSSSLVLSIPTNRFEIISWRPGMVEVTSQGLGFTALAMSFHFMEENLGRCQPYEATAEEHFTAAGLNKIHIYIRNASHSHTI